MDASRHGVDPVTDLVEVLLGVDTEIRALADVAVQQSIEVFVRRPQPRTVGLGEDNANADGRGEIVGGYSLDQFDATGVHAGCVVSLGKVANQVESAGQVHERHDRRSAPCADDEVAFEVADLGVLPGDLSPQADQVELAEWAGLLLGRLTGPTPTFPTMPLSPCVRKAGRARGPKKSLPMGLR